MISRRDAMRRLAATVTGAWAAPLPPPRVAQPPPRPNVVFVLMDDMRWDYLGCAGHPFVRTPNLDRLAREGARLSNAFVCVSLCSPSRASFLTGLYPAVHGVFDNRTPLDFSRVTTFPQRLQRAGYRTAMFGKWHMGVDDEPKPGFDHWACFPGQGRYFDPVLNVGGERRTFGGYTDDVTTGLACQWIEQQRGGPFALMLGFKSCHSPFEPPPRVDSLYADVAIPRPPTFDRAGPDKPAWVQSFDDTGHTPYSRLPFDDLVRRFARLVTAADENVGRLCAALERSGVLDRTLLVFSSDNGFLVHEHGLYDKRGMYEESIRIPLLVRYPPLVKPRSRPDGIALNVDITPTIAALAGAGALDEMQGASLIPLVSGRRRRIRTLFFYQYEREQPYSTPSLVGVRDAEWKLVQYREPGQSPELYNVRRDPYEQRNLFEAPQARATRRRLERELERLAAQAKISRPMEDAEEAEDAETV